MKNKICPILSVRSEAMGIDCMQGDCSWFAGRNNCCALLLLAEAADTAADQLEEIAVGDPLDGIQN